MSGLASPLPSVWKAESVDGIAKKEQVQDPTTCSGFDATVQDSAASAAPLVALHAAATTTIGRHEPLRDTGGVGRTTNPG